MADILETIKKIEARRSAELIERTADIKEEEVYIDEIKEARRLSALPEDEKCQKVMELRRRGLGISTIGKMVGVSPNQVTKWINQHIENKRTQIESQPAANILVENLDFLSHMEDLVLYELNMVRDGTIIIDKETGEISKKPVNVQAKSAFIKLALKVREMKMDLEVQTGVLPKQPERIYHTMESNKEQDSLRPDLDRSEEEIKENLLRLLERGRSV